MISIRNRFMGAAGARLAIAGAALLLVLPASANPGAEGRVTRLTVGVKPHVFSATCPAHLEFIGTIAIEASHPITVEYRWERSDGAQGPTERVEVRGKGRGVFDHWELGAAHEHYQVWEKLHVLSPNGILSSPAAIRVNYR